jgi:S-adenosylmethionine synthetase
VLDAVLATTRGRVAVRDAGDVTVTEGDRGLGEITTEPTFVDIQTVARETIRDIGYTAAELGFDCDTCAVINAIDKQSPDIAQGVTRPTRRADGRRGRARRRRAPATRG